METMRKAFTLVEMLVVVAIIGVLMAFLLPMMSRSREHARMTKCMNNQKQVAVAIRAFSMDHSDYCPGANGPVSGPGATTYRGAGQLISLTDTVSQAELEKTSMSILVTSKYLTNSEVMRCPQQEAWRDSLMTSQPSSNTAAFHYAFNQMFVGDTKYDPVTFLPKFAAPPPAAPVGTLANSVIPLTRATNPSGCVLVVEDGFETDAVVETKRTKDVDLDRIHATPYHHVRGARPTDAAPYIRADFAACSYVDGHVEMIQVIVLKDDPNALTVPTDDAGLR